MLEVVVEDKDRVHIDYHIHIPPEGHNRTGPVLVDGDVFQNHVRLGAVDEERRLLLRRECGLWHDALGLIEPRSDVRMRVLDRCMDVHRYLRISMGTLNAEK